MTIPSVKCLYIIVSYRVFSVVSPLVIFLVTGLFSVRSSARGEKQVAMKAVGPDCGIEVLYRRTWDKGRHQERYSVHARRVDVDGIPAFQSISIYPDRVRRVTMRRSDLTPLAVVEKWNRGDKLIQRTYHGNKVHMVRRGLPDPVDEVFEADPGVHDPESFAFLLRGYPFGDQDSVAPIDVLVADANPLFSRPLNLSFSIIPRGEERITVVAGTFDCYKMEMGIAGLLGYITPSNSFWLLKDDPHLIVKAEALGETVELVGGPFACDGKEHCTVGVEVPDIGKSYRD